MAAHSSLEIAGVVSERVSRRSRPPVSEMRLRVAPQDGATTLALSLASVRAAHRLDVLALCDLDGALLASAGDAHAAAELAPLAASAARETPERRAAILPRLGVIVDVIESGVRGRDARTWVVAATATDPFRDVSAIVAAVEDILPRPATSSIVPSSSLAPASAPESLDGSFGLELDDDLFGDLFG
jgi:hypothetical protein